MSIIRVIVLSLSLVSSVILLSACGKDTPSYGLLPEGQNFTQTNAVFNNQLDILWVVDNSGSMAPLQANMVNNFNSFVSTYQAAGWDFRMAVTTTDAYKADPNFVGYDSSYASMAKFMDGTPQTSYTNVFVIIPTTPNLDATFVTNATTGIDGSGDERAFSSLRTAMNSSLNAGFLRPTSFFAVIILSDEDDFSNNNRAEDSWGNNDALDHCYVNSTMDQIATTAYSGNNHISTCAHQTPPDTVASYESYLDQLTNSTGITRRYNVSAISVLDSACQLSHSQSNSASFVSIIGQRYVQLSQDTNGVTGSICDTSYANSLSAIAGQIASLSSQFFLNQIPQQGTITVTVNGASVPDNSTNGWQYSSAANSIVFYGTAIPPQGASIQINYVPTTVKN